MNKISLKKIYACKFYGLTIDSDSSIANDTKGPGYNLNARG
ncbi:MAG: hypothetical protein ACP5TZ_04975 [Nitrososphaeria archaeon]